MMKEADESAENANMSNLPYMTERGLCRTMVENSLIEGDCDNINAVNEIQHDT